MTGHDQYLLCSQRPGISVLTVSKSEFKAKMLEYFRKLEETGEPVLVTSHGKPVARVVPFRDEQDVDELFADVRGHVRYHRDPLEPTLDEWPDP
jgi:prevent-host-death family protein